MANCAVFAKLYSLIAQISLISIHSYLQFWIHQTSFAKQIYWQICQTIVPTIFRCLWYNTVCTNSALLFILWTIPCMEKGVKAVCLVNKSKPVCWLQVKNTMTSKVKWQWWHIVLMDPRMTDIRQQWLIARNYLFSYSKDNWWNCMVLLILLINTLCLIWIC